MSEDENPWIALVETVLRVGMPQIDPERLGAVLVKELGPDWPVVLGMLDAETWADVKR